MNKKRTSITLSKELYGKLVTKPLFSVNQSRYIENILRKEVGLPELKKGD